MDPGSAAHRKSAAQHPGNAFLIPGVNAVAFILRSIAKAMRLEGCGH
jgi:hypothetical protein